MEGNEVFSIWNLFLENPFFWPGIEIEGIERRRMAQWSTEFSLCPEVTLVFETLDVNTVFIGHGYICLRTGQLAKR